MSTLRTRMFGLPVVITEKHNEFHALRGEYVDMIEVRYDMTTNDVLTTLPYDMRTTRAFIVDLSDREAVTNAVCDAMAIMVADYRSAEVTMFTASWDDDTYGETEREYIIMESVRTRVMNRDEVRWGIHSDASGWATKCSLGVTDFLQD